MDEDCNIKDFGTWKRKMLYYKSKNRENPIIFIVNP